MLTLNDGRSELWQWDTGRTLAVDADCSQVHFSNKVFGRSIDVDVVDGAAIIPDILLQTDKDLNVWAFVGTAENGYTKISKTFKVNRRNKPADYVFTPADQMTIQTIQSQIGDLADLTTEAKDTLVAAINEAARTGGGAGSMELRVAEGYVQYSRDGGMTWTNLIAMADLKGDPGTAGNDGHSPVVTATKSGKTTTISVDGAAIATVEDGADGKSAYAYAVEGGYTGTETEFAAKLAEDIPTVDDTLTQSGQAADAAAVGNRLSALSEEKVDNSGWTGNKYLGTDSDGNVVEKDGLSDSGPTYSDLQIEMPIGAAELLNAVRIQNAANNATLLSTEGNLAHNAMAEICGGVVFVTWTENTVGTTVDYANGSGSCSVLGRMLRYKFGVSQTTPVWSDITDIMDLFPIGSTVYDSDGAELGTIIDVSDSTLYSPEKGLIYLSAMAYCSDINGQRPVTRTITYDSSLSTASITNDVLVFGNITAWTLTIDGVSGDYDFSRINSGYKKRPQINSKPISNKFNNRKSGFLLPIVIDNVGVAVLESTDMIAWNLLCILPDADAYLEASMFLAASNRWFIAIRCKKNNIPTVHIIKVRTDTYSILDGWYTKLRGTDSRPCFLNNYSGQPFANYPILFLSDYNRNGGRIVIIEDSDSQHVRTLATLRGNLSNYSQLISPSGSVNWNTTLKQIALIIGTNGSATDKRGVSVAQVFLDPTQYDDLADMVELLSGGISNYELPVAGPDTLGGVKPVTKTDSMKQPVGVDASGGLFVELPSGAAEIIDTLIDATLEKEETGITVNVDSVKYKEFLVHVECVGTATNTEKRAVQLMINNKAAAWTPAMENMTTDGTKTWGTLKVTLYDDCVWYLGTNTKTTNNTTMNEYINGITTDVNRNTVVTTLTVRAFNAWAVLGAGTKILVKGIRA